MNHKSGSLLSFGKQQNICVVTKPWPLLPSNLDSFRNTTFVQLFFSHDKIITITGFVGLDKFRLLVIDIINVTPKTGLVLCFCEKSQKCCKKISLCRIFYKLMGAFLWFIKQHSAKQEEHFQFLTFWHFCCCCCC